MLNRLNEMLKDDDIKSAAFSLMDDYHKIEGTDMEILPLTSGGSYMQGFVSWVKSIEPDFNPKNVRLIRYGSEIRFESY